jgi:N-acetylmuramoyl-L-alanine amidase CwlA
MLEITQKLIAVPSQRRSGQKLLGVFFLVAHDTGNDGSTALQNATYFGNSANDMQASAHFFVDDKQIICCVPETEKAWHVRYDVPKDNQIFGKDANDWALGIELSYHSGNSKINNQVAYKNYVDLFASLCQKYNLSPHQRIIGHYTLDPTRRTDPINAFKFVGKTWDNFIDDVEKTIVALTTPPPMAQPDKFFLLMTDLQTLINKYR